MTTAEFYEKIEKEVQLPIFYETIDVEQEDELPPVYVYFVTGETNIFEADNIVYWNSTPCELVIVHGSGISEGAKASVEKFLNDNRLPFTHADSYDNDLTSWLTTYSFDF